MAHLGLPSWRDARVVSGSRSRRAAGEMCGRVSGTYVEWDDIGGRARFSRMFEQMLTIISFLNSVGQLALAIRDDSSQTRLVRFRPYIQRRSGILLVWLGLKRALVCLRPDFRNEWCGRSS